MIIMIGSRNRIYTRRLRNLSVTQELLQMLWKLPISHFSEKHYHDVFLNEAHSLTTILKNETNYKYIVESIF